jgi:hypothetical protein
MKAPPLTFKATEIDFDGSSCDPLPPRSEIAVKVSIMAICVTTLAELHIATVRPIAVSPRSLAWSPRPLPQEPRDGGLSERDASYASAPG